MAAGRSRPLAVPGRYNNRSFVASLNSSRLTMSRMQSTIVLRRVPPRSAWLLIVALLALLPITASSGDWEVEQSTQKKPPCDWLQEVKRTNTWFERDQNGRRNAYLLHEQKRLGEPITDQELSAARDAVSAEARVLQSELDDLVVRCGWPTTSGYGDKAPQYAAFIVQHADLPFQEKYLPMMQAAADANELAPRHVAMVVDRILMRKGLPQRYGSQLTSEGNTLVVYQIEDPEHVDERRSAVGMVPASFCAYIATFTPIPQSDLCEISKPRNAASK